MCRSCEDSAHRGHRCAYAPDAASALVARGLTAHVVRDQAHTHARTQQQERATVNHASADCTARQKHRIHQYHDALIRLIAQHTNSLYQQCDGMHVRTQQHAEQRELELHTQYTTITNLHQEMSGVLDAAGNIDILLARTDQCNVLTHARPQTLLMIFLFSIHYMLFTWWCVCVVNRLTGAIESSASVMTSVQQCIPYEYPVFPRKMLFFYVQGSQ